MNTSTRLIRATMLGFLSMVAFAVVFTLGVAVVNPERPMFAIALVWLYSAVLWYGFEGREL